MRLSRVDGAAAGDRTVVLVGGGDVTTRSRVLEAGDGSRSEGTLEPLSGFDTRYRWRHAVARRPGDRAGRLRPRRRSPLDRLANRRGRQFCAARTGSRRRNGHCSPASCSATPVRSPDDLVDDFRDAGLSHLLAVSGANVAFVLAIAGPLLRRLRLGEPAARRAARAGAVRHDDALGAVGAAGMRDGCASRWPRRSSVAPSPRAASSRSRRSACSSSTRSCCTRSASCCRRARRPGSSGSAPAFSARDPRPGGRRRRARRHGRGADRRAAGAPPGVRDVPLIALPANLLAAPVVGPLTVWGLVAGRRRWPPGPGVARALQLPTYALLRWVETRRPHRGGRPDRRRRPRPPRPHRARMRSRRTLRLVHSGARRRRTPHRALGR